MMTIIFEAHATTLYNEAGLASGWNDVALSETGKKQAKELGKRYSLEEFDVVYCADMQRTYHTAQLAFPAITTEKLLLDWRLRECDYGDLTGTNKTKVGAEKINRIDTPFPGGESYTQAMARMKSFIDDLRPRTDFQKVLVIGSRATHFGFDYWLEGKKLEDLLSQKMIWQPGWTYELSSDESYATTLAVSSAVIEQNGKYLLVQEKQQHVYGKWNFPGGRVDSGETLEAAAVREAREETGLEVQVGRQLYVHHQDITRAVLHAYSAEVIGGELEIQADEILDACWFSHDEILAMKSELRSPDYIISAIRLVSQG